MKDILDGHFMLSYVPEDNYTEIGYHKTLCIKLDSIRKNGFEPSKNKDDWLGLGVYFWDNIENARWWNVGTGAVIKPCIIICELKCDLSQYLDLDKEMDKLDKFCQKYIKELNRQGLPKPYFKNSHEKKKFFCDLYCKQKNFTILSYTFKHDIMNHAGFKIDTKERRQICVKNPKHIQILSVDGGD